jgi:hypothetical protein
LVASAQLAPVQQCQAPYLPFTSRGKQQIYSLYYLFALFHGITILFILPNYNEADAIVAHGPAITSENITFIPTMNVIPLTSSFALHCYLSKAPIESFNWAGMMVQSDPERVLAEDHGEARAGPSSSSSERDAGSTSSPEGKGKGKDLRSKEEMRADPEGKETEYVITYHLLC